MSATAPRSRAFWLGSSKSSARRTLTEIDVVAALESFRRDGGLLRDVSFPTIAGAGPNGAIVHYRVTTRSNRVIAPGELLLVDSGGQYQDGTTDITRTVAIGTPTEEMRDRFTRVLKGHIAIARAVFPGGTTGAQLDSFARQFLWAAGLDFDHGTGHGVGSYLSVHEGPGRISKLGTTPLARGMILSNEPGYYKAGGYGIRIENLILVVAADTVAGADKPLNAFETLTLAPIDRRLVDHCDAHPRGNRLARPLSCLRRGDTVSARRPEYPRLARHRHPPARAGMTASPPLDPNSEDAGRSAAYRAPYRAPWRLLALLIAMSGVSSLSLNILVPAIPSMVAKFATEPANIQLTVSLYLLGLATAQLVLGPLSDRFGRRPVVLAGLAVAAVASSIAIFAASVVGLVTARVAQSLGASTGQSIGRAIIRDLYDRERAASMIGLVTSVVVLMPMAAPLIGGILDTLFGWESIFVFTALLSFGVFAWALVALPETHRFSVATGERVRFRADLGALAASPQFFAYALCAGLGSAPFFSFLGGAPHVVVTMLGRTSAEYGLWFFVPSFGFMAGNFAVSRLTTRFGIDALIWWGIALTIVGLPRQYRGLSRLPGLGHEHDLPAAAHRRLGQRSPAANVDRRRGEHSPANRRHRLGMHRFHPDGDRRRRRPARRLRGRPRIGRDADAVAHVGLRHRDRDGLSAAAGSTDRPRFRIGSRLIRYRRYCERVGRFARASIRPRLSAGPIARVA